MSPLHFRILLWASIALALVMASLPQPPALPFEPSDKLQHMLAFAVITLLAMGAHPMAKWWQIFLPLTALGAAIEIVQLIPALNRSSEFADWAVDTLAIGASLLIGAFVRTLPARS